MKICVLGLGYVGAPLAVELAKHFTVIGFDIKSERVHELVSNRDSNNELSQSQLSTTTAMFTHEEADLADCTVYIVTVPTPVTDANVPDLNPVKSASTLVARWLKPGDIVIYESTVYPGVTEEICVPILEAQSSLSHKTDFHVGYSPERINPGDKVHTLTTTTKIVSGDDSSTLDVIDTIYSAITRTYRAPSIKVAEAAKVIENTQRDVNIALVNELSQIFNRLGVDTNDVIDAAASKWNFQPFRPGLVGGHCISVDPYYLSHKAATQGFVADVILSAREINDSVASFVVSELVKLLARNRLLGEDVKVSILGCTFKENVPDIRNSKIFTIIDQLKQYDITPQVIDPMASEQDVLDEYGLKINNPVEPADAILLAVSHEEFMAQGWSLASRYTKPGQRVVVMDLKGVLDRSACPDFVDLWRP